MDLSRLLFRSLIGLVSTGTVVHSAVTSTVARAAESSEDAHSANESAVFARYSALEEAETEAKLKELTASDDTYETLATLNKYLASGASSKEVEATVLTLVAKLDSTEADTTLAAVLLDYYETYLRDDLSSGALTPADVYDVLDGHNDVLTAATYGSDWRKDKRIRMARRRR